MSFSQTNILLSAEHEYVQAFFTTKKGKSIIITCETLVNVITNFLLC